jgi:hypothetical protein
MNYCPVATKFTMLVVNRKEVGRINCQANSSNGRLILVKKMYDSSRDVPIIFTDGNQTYTALTDGFL